MIKLYRGCSASSADGLTKKPPTSFTDSGNGEFGVGCYFWLDDMPAAILSALQYHSTSGDWAVICLEFQDADLHQSMQPQAGFGPRVLEFDHKRLSPFSGQPLTTRRVIPWEHSYVPKSGESPAQAVTRVQTMGTAPAKSSGIMTAPQFRSINAEPATHGLVGEKNKLAWQYPLIIGPCAADYTDEKLVQVKVANQGLTFINDTARVTRKIVIRGSKVVTRRKMVDAWKMAQRDDIYDKYFKDKASVDLDRVIPG